MEPEKMAVAGVVIAIVVVGLALGVSVLGFQTNDNGGTGLTGITTDTDLLELGLQVPDNWEFDLSDGTTLKLSDLEGKVILVDLMATWCSTCAAQNSYLESAHESLSGPLVILSLTVDHSETIAMMADYKADRGLSWDHGLDTGQSFTNYFKVTTVPTLVLIDGDGYFRYVHVGTWSEVVISDKVMSIV
jgi:thiol-disulfide isomerase/thioredoxin